MGLRDISDIAGKNPNLLYKQLNDFSGTIHDICMLYTFRCAVYYATETKHYKEKLNWWYWKDKSYNE
ncbi:MAG: helix-hairpin-helix domain-containing protein [Saprospiraceae bacterium]